MLPSSKILDRLFSLFATGKAKVGISTVDGTLPTERPVNQINSFNHTIVTSSGSVSSGKYAINLEFSSDFVGTLQGTSIGANKIIYLETDYNSILPEIVYTITSGSIRILTLEP